MDTHNTLYIIGPSASGKSDFAVRLAQHYNGVIINADSMQIYQGVRIVTAIPDTHTQQGIPHMLYGCVSPLKPFDVTQWRRRAVACIQQVLQMGKTPILCGGTGLYAAAIMHGLSPIPDINPTIRQTVRNMDAQMLYTALQTEDPIMAKRLHRGDTHRLARALEIVRSTGTSLAHYQNIPPILIPADIRIKMVALLPKRQTLYDRINHRFAHMFKNGAVDEVQQLLRMGVDDTAQILRAIGIAEIVAYIQGKYDKHTAITHGKTATRRYAKRQITYIRHQLNPHIIIEDTQLFDMRDILLYKNNVH